MNEVINSARATASRKGGQMRVPDTSMLPAAETAQRMKAGRLDDGHHERNTAWRKTVQRHPLAVLFTVALLGAVIARLGS